MARKNYLLHFEINVEQVFNPLLCLARLDPELLTKLQRRLGIGIVQIVSNQDVLSQLLGSLQFKYCARRRSLSEDRESEKKKENAGARREERGKSKVRKRQVVEARSKSRLNGRPVMAATLFEISTRAEKRSGDLSAPDWRDYFHGQAHESAEIFTSRGSRISTRLFSFLSTRSLSFVFYLLVHLLAHARTSGENLRLKLLREYCSRLSERYETARCLRRN